MMNEMPSCYGCDQRKARKAHRCCECHGTIQPGETYHYHHGVWEGVGASYKVCADCEALRAECDSDAKHGEGTAFCELFEAVTAMRASDGGPLTRLAAIMRKRVAVVPRWMAERADAFAAGKWGAK